jgi:hypothetical protein
MMAKGTSLSEDVATALFVVIGTPLPVDMAGMDAAGVGFVVGKVAWFGGMMLCIGLIVYWSVLVAYSVRGCRLTSLIAKLGTGIVVVLT